MVLLYGEENDMTTNFRKRLSLRAFSSMYLSLSLCVCGCDYEFLFCIIIVEQNGGTYSKYDSWLHGFICLVF